MYYLFKSKFKNSHNSYEKTAEGRTKPNLHNSCQN